MLKKLCDGAKCVGQFLQSPLLLVIRLYWGYQFVLAGYGKFQHLSDVAGFFQTLGIPMPYLNALFAASAEFACGALLLVGLFSRIVSIPLFFVMLVAYATAHTDSLVTLFTKFDPDPFFHEGPFLFAYAALLVFCFGPGKISLDYLVTAVNKTKEMP